MSAPQKTTAELAAEYGLAPNEYEVLLDRLGRRDLTRGLSDWVGKKDAPFRPLDPGRPVARASESRKWRLLVNARPEPET